ncbi:MAG: hypothetical protein AB7O24_34235 [Kofleriaceae bacterium]
MRTVIIAAVMCSAVTAAATPSDQSRAEFAKAQAQYSAGHYLEAAALFEAAYKLDPDPAYLFNIAQAYRLGRDCAKSLEYFERFRAEVPELPAIQAEQFDSFVREAKVCAADHERLRLEKSGVYARQARARRLRIAGISLAAAGGAVALGGGLYFSHRGNELQSQREGLCDPGCTWDAMKDATAKRLESDGKRANTLLIFSYGVGGALVIGGVVSYLLGRDDSTETIAVVPTDGGALVTRQISF